MIGEMHFWGDDVPLLMVVNFALLCVIAVKAVVMIVTATYYYRTWRTYMAEVKQQQNETARQQMMTAKQQNEVWSVLQIMKDYAESARANRVETVEAAKEIRDNHPTRADISQQIEAVPAKTAEEVVKKIKNGDSGVRHS